MRNTLLTALALSLLWPPVGRAQSSQELEALRKQVEALAAGQAQIRKDLEEIKALLRARPAPPPAPSPVEPVNLAVSIDGWPSKGNAAAKVVLVEFSDYQCPYCSRHVQQTHPLLEKEYIQTGKVRFVFRDFPIESLHKQAFKAHEAAHCAGEQGKYWEMHDLLFANQAALLPEQLSMHAKVTGANAAKFDECLASGRYAPKVRQGIGEAQRAGATGTPAFVVGLVSADGKNIRAVRRIRGAQPYATFKDAVDAVLAEAGAKTQGQARLSIRPPSTRIP